MSSFTTCMKLNGGLSHIVLRADSDGRPTTFCGRTMSNVALKHNVKSLRFRTCKVCAQIVRDELRQAAADMAADMYGGADD